MGLDVYVGSITRYLCGDWETVVQQYARETGLELRIIRKYDPPDAIRDPVEVLPIVLRWRESISASVQDLGGPPLDWDERPEAPYFTDKPAWDAYGDLMLWAAYTERTLTPPTTSSTDWYNDPIFSAAAKGDTDYPALLTGAEVWFPVDFPFTFRASWITGDDLVYGSAPQLARELNDLNVRTFRASTEHLKESRNEGKEQGDPLEKGARFGLAILSAMTTAAIEHKLVMKLDY
jgi:hypothetical protein